ncbi:MAG: hypothetical protein ACJAYB_003450 [Psychromonas sp.]|jgi:hypothetical protein
MTQKARLLAEYAVKHSFYIKNIQLEYCHLNKTAISIADPISATSGP